MYAKNGTTHDVGIAAANTRHDANVGEDVDNCKVLDRKGYFGREASLYYTSGDHLAYAGGIPSGTGCVVYSIIDSSIAVQVSVLGQPSQKAFQWRPCAL